MAAPAPMAAVLSNKFIVDNDEMRDNLFDVDQKRSPIKRNISGNRIILGFSFLLICQDNKRFVITYKPY
jgi:hypothetical protein